MEERQLCLSCHQELQQIEKLRYQHQPVARGTCLACHTPHVSDKKGLLPQDLAATCLTCHQELQHRGSVVHPPFDQGECQTCHLPHGSDNPRMLNAAPAALCSRCHEQLPQTAAHDKFSSQPRNCLSCHTPHFSNESGLLRAFPHAPFPRKCDSCHRQTNGQASKEICLQCHAPIQAKAKSLRSHLLIGVPDGCMVCHSPHGGDDPNMLFRQEKGICQGCHASSLALLEQALSVHPNIERCHDCHAVHGSNQLAMLNADPITVCTGCHGAHDKFTHPLGQEYTDRRTGQPLTCLTCHNPMGTDFQYQLRQSGKRDLCTQCHQNY